jgi:hypothetical protein
MSAPPDPTKSAEFVEGSTTALTVADVGVHFVTSVDEAKVRVEQLQEFIGAVMVPGVDYGTIPGTPKPTLFKPGAEKLCEIYGLASLFEVVNRIEDWDEGFFHYETKCRLVSQRTGVVVAEGLGSCNSRERRFRNQDAFSVVNCVTPQTRILTRDLRWVPAGQLETGDKLIAVEEAMGSRDGRAFRDAEATVYGRRTDDLYQVTMKDGRTVRCNGEHRWLVKKIGLSGTEWVATSEIFREIRERKGRPRRWQIMSLCSPWQEETTRDAGYLAGPMDADGTLSAGSIGKDQRWLSPMRLDGRRFEGEPVEVASVEPIGPGEIVLLGSTAGTYVAEGMVCHNTILKMSKKRSHVDAALSATRSSGIFTQDLEDVDLSFGRRRPGPVPSRSAPPPRRVPARPDLVNGWNRLVERGRALGIVVEPLDPSWDDAEILRRGAEWKETIAAVEEAERPANGSRA